MSVLFDGLRRVFHLDRGSRGVEAEVDLELEHHFAAAVDDMVRRGIEAAEARRVTERRFGDLPTTRAALIALSQSRAEQRRRWEWRSDWWLDLKYAVRSFTSAPVVAIAVVTILALGIGANAAMYGILAKLFFQPPPHIQAPSEIVRLYLRERNAFTGFQVLTHEQFDFEQYSALKRGAPGVALAGYWQGPGRVGHGQQARQLGTGVVTGTFFSLLGVRPTRGRFIDPSDDTPGATPAAVISYGLWRREFGGSNAALGRTLDLDRITYTIVGVAPRGFSGADVNAADIWIPVQIVGPTSGEPYWRQRRYGGLPLRVLARLGAGMTPAVLAAQATAALQALDEGAPLPGPAGVVQGPPPLGPEARVLTGSIMEAQGPTGAAGLRLPVIVGGVALILLVIASANVANLLALRATARRRELAVRSALGAGRWRVVRLLALESMMLALIAGIAAAAVAAGAGRVLRLILLPRYHWASGALDLRVLGVAGLLALAIGLVTGLLPALHGAGASSAEDLKAGSRTSRRARTPLRAALLVLQGALALVLVIGAAAFFRSFDTARRHDPGYDLEHLVAVTLSPLDPTDESPLPEDRISAMEKQVRHLPGVVDVAQTTNTAPLSFTMLRLKVRGLESLPRMNGPYGKGVTPNFFRVDGLAIRRGRAFTPGDGEGAPKVAIVNQEMAQAVWPSADPLGACLYVGSEAAECTTVVGVVATEDPRIDIQERLAQYYVPLAQFSRAFNRRSLLIRASGDPSGLVTPTLRILGDLFPDLPRERVRSLADVIASQLGPWKLGLELFGAASVLALLLAAVGLYAVIAYSVRQREHEFGIRRALGAHVSDLMRLVLVQSASFAVLGTLVGVAAAYWGARFVNPLLYQNLTARDPAILAIAGAVLIAASFTAGVFPARAAAHVDPRAALQAE